MTDEPEQPPAGESGAKKSRGPGKRSIDPDEFTRIGDMVARRVPYRKIALIYGVDEKTIRLIYRNEVLPNVKASPARSVEAELHRADNLEAFCWRKLMSGSPAETVEQVKEELKAGDGQTDQKTSFEMVERVVKKIRGKGQVAWAGLILEIFKHRCQIEGHYAPKRIRVETEEEFRVGGSTPDEALEGKIIALAKRIADVKIREARRRGDRVIVDGELLSIETTNGHQ